MSSVIAVPKVMTSAATDLAKIGLDLNAAHAVAAAPTLAVLPAAADEISTGVAQLFAEHAQGYQALAGQAAAFHEQFVQHLNASAGTYASAEAANVASLQPLGAVAQSIGGAAAAVPGDAVSLFGTLQSQLLNLLTTIRGQLLNLVVNALLLLAGLFLAVFVFTVLSAQFVASAT